MIGRFVADFYCSECQLVVEVDGGAHQAHREADAERDHIFATMGLRVVRVRNEQVLTNLDAVVGQVEAALGR